MPLEVVFDGRKNVLVSEGKIALMVGGLEGERTQKWRSLGGKNLPVVGHGEEKGFRSGGQWQEKINAMGHWEEKIPWWQVTGR